MNKKQHKKESEQARREFVEKHKIEMFRIAANIAGFSINVLHAKILIKLYEENIKEEGNLRISDILNIVQQIHIEHDRETQKIINVEKKS